MRFIERFIGRRENVPVEENKEFKARMIWDRIGALLDSEGFTAFSAVEITKALPENIKNWEYLNNISAPLIVSIHTEFGRIVIVKVISGSDHYVKAVIRGPVDTTPIVTEGEIGDDEIPSITQFQDPLEFTRKLSIFLSHQRKISQDIPEVGGVGFKRARE